MKIVARALVTIAFLCCAILATGQASSSAAGSAASEWKQVGEAMGRPGQLHPGDVIKFGLPRKDLHGVLDGVDIKAGLALGSWVAFKRDGGGAMVMGDLILLLGGEVNPVIKALRQNRIAVTALHSHMLMEEPRLFFMHFWANDDAVKLAK